MGNESREREWQTEQLTPLPIAASTRTNPLVHGTYDIHNDLH